MLFRALAAFVALPGLVAFTIPLAIGISTEHPMRHQVLAAMPLCLGTILLLSCVREFYNAGRGTLAPWDPPRHLVTSGPYRFSRDPMYIGVVTILAGWCILWDSRALVVYAASFAVGFHFRVILFEEPWAARQFGAEWQAYRTKVSRWI
jgi:protein-S-isoprenylcysteine O-methyltransferase Ste14